MRRAARPLVYLGIVGAVVGLSVYHARIIANPPYSYTGTFRFGWSLLYIVILIVTAYGFGLPEIVRTPRQALVTSIAAVAVSALAISLVQLLIGDALLPRFVVFGAPLVLVPWYVLCVALAGTASTGTGHDRALVVSDTVDPAQLREEVARGPERPVIVIEVLPVAAAITDGSPKQPLIERFTRDRATVLVLDAEAQASPSVVAQAAEVHRQGFRVRTLSLFYEEWLGMLPLTDLERVSLLFDIGEVHRAQYGRLKRVIDLVLATIGLLALAIAIPFVLIGDLVGNRGSLFYGQPRVGKNGKVFRILKFRTMRPHEGTLVNEWTAENDPRITPFGRLLRLSHVDELPQVINILRGDLAVVGPRPEQPHYVEELTEKLPFYDMRHLVRPGLTGWAQVKYGYAGDESDALEKLQYEFFYLRRQSFGFDVRIIGRTIRSVLGREGR